MNSAGTVIAVLAWLAAGWGTAGSQAAAGNGDMWLDHVPIAVHDLARATIAYRKLGFTVRPGRSHPNTIANAFVSFSNGTQLELITATERGDSLASWYVDFLKSHEGPAFVALGVDSITLAEDRLRAAGIEFHDTGPEPDGFRTVTLEVPEPFRRLFLIHYAAAPRRNPAGHRHPNTAVGMRTVWIAVDDMMEASAWMVRLGFRAGHVVPLQRINGLGREFRLGEGGSVVLVAATDISGITANRLVTVGPGIMGVTLEVTDLGATVEAVRSGTGRHFVVTAEPDGSGQSLLVPPRFTGGVWLEFRQPPASPPSPAPAPPSTSP